MEGYYTIKEAAERLGVSERTVRRRIKDDSLPAKKMLGQYGQQWFIPVQAIETAQEITEVVEVKRSHDVQALTLAIVQALESRDNAMKAELEALTAEVAAGKEQMEQLRSELEWREKELLRLLKESRRSWLEKLFKRN